MTTKPDLPAVADRIAAGIVAYALTNLFDLLDQAISETISDDPDAPEDGTVARDDLWDAVIARLKAAPTEYQRRDQVLTEAAALLREHRGDLDEPDTAWWDTRDRDLATRLLYAARTGQEASPASDASRLIEVISDISARLEQYHDRLVFEYPDVADALQPLIDQLNHATSQEH